MYLFEELHVAHCGQEEKWMVAIVDWPLLQAAQLDINAQLEAETQVWKLEKQLKV